ncbi:MAG: sigma-70 family RNA polymerase sigma factor [Fimbriimonadaceae bacterium]|jgi:RNA polymerase sigma-70 factor (ECF subfamily)|nr:sigma-70 family RNA polymerase sigma factor [Fimbriimonadaceae bacterium]
MSQALDDAVLIRQAQGGDRAAFDNLVRKYESRAYQYAFRLTRNSDVASDIVADAFVRVFSALNNFRGQSAFGTWLYRIITNCYLDLKKKDKSRYLVSLEGQTDSGQEVERQIPDVRPGPDLEAEKSAREEVVQKALDQMPEYQRAMLVMYHVEMLSYEEIAEALDLPIGTVKSRLNRARLALRELLSSDQELFLTS